MIYFVLHEYHRYAVKNFLDAWGRGIWPQVRILTHQELRYAHRLPRGTYVFGDVDRLSDAERGVSAEAADVLAAAGCRILNHPSHVACRLELARRLETEGLNAYRTFRATEDWTAARFPVFVRREDDHGGLQRELLHDADAVRAAIAAAGDPNEVLVVEYLDTRGADGLYRKYSALRIGEHLFARHELFSRKWIVKYADLVDPHLVEEEDRYLAEFESDTRQREQVKRCFELAGIEYGRIDYSLTADGRVQCWEINLSPNLSSPPDKIAAGRLVQQQKISAKIVAGIASLEDGSTLSTPQIRIRHDPDLLKASGVTWADRWLWLSGKLVLRVERLPCVRLLVRHYQRARWLATR